MATAQWGVFERAFESGEDHADPFRDVEAAVRFEAPSGRTRQVEAFWDGGRTWRVRFSPDEPGTWRYRTSCAVDAVLEGREGTFECGGPAGERLGARGPIRLADDLRHFEHADGTAFFYLADTAWNGVLRASAEQWARYLSRRAEQGFSAVQFVCTHWRACAADPVGDVAWEGVEDIRLNPAFFARMDAKVAAINAHGLVGVPVLLWALKPCDPGRYLAEADAIRVARYVAARWGAHNVIWLLGGDGAYTGESAARWCRVGKAVFGNDPDRRDRLVSMHPQGVSSYAADLGGEAWLDFLGYKSGHGDSEDHLRWTAEGPMSTDWRRRPTRPVVNLEPNYEYHVGYHHKTVHGAREVRRAAWWSLLAAPPAGITYGNNHIWPWNHEPGPAPDHPGCCPGDTCGPWERGLDMPGVEGMGVLAGFFRSFEWWQLRPAPDALAQQPGREQVARYVSVARTDDGAFLVAYTPAGDAVALRAAAAPPGDALWLDPRTGQMRPAAPDGARYAPPDDRDWVLTIGAGAC